MITHPPYLITQVRLDEQPTLPSLNKEHQGDYLVFWWGDYALGDLYLDPGTKLSEQEYYDKLIAAILPAVNFYAPNGQDAHKDWQQWLKYRKFIDLAAWLKAVLPPVPSENIPEKVPVSVVVCTRNRSAQLQHCLAMLTKLTCVPEEIIVVDNAPTDNSTQEVVQQFKEATYVREPRIGLDIARNTGAKRAACPVIAYVDDDVQVHHLWLYRVWETFKEPSTAAMTGLVIAAELKTEAQYIFEKHWSFNRGYTSKLYDSSFFNATLTKGPPVWKIGAGANMAFRKEVFEEVGYFNEFLDVGAAGCNGDSEMWYRILSQGYNIRYNPLAVVFHEHRKEIEGLKKQLFYYMRGFTTAALLQQQAGYKRQLYWSLPKQYARLLRAGFPDYRYRYRTIISEIMGVFSGLAYYYRIRNQSKL